MKTQSRYFIAFIICLAFVAACGQQGPLFLPGSPSEIEQELSGQQMVPIEKSEDDDEKDDEEQTDNIN